MNAMRTSATVAVYSFLALPVIAILLFAVCCVLTIAAN